jgi:hypothetical protein
VAIREQIASADNKLTLTVRSAERSAHGAKGYFNKLLEIANVRADLAAAYLVQKKLAKVKQLLQQAIPVQEK